MQNYEAQTTAASAPEAPVGAILSGAAARKLAAAQSQQYQAAMQPQFIPQMQPPPFYPMQPGQMPYPYFEHPAFVITQQPQLNPFVHPPQFQHAIVSPVVQPAPVIPLTGVLMQPKTAVKGSKYDKYPAEILIKPNSNLNLANNHIHQTKASDTTRRSFLEQNEHDLTRYASSYVACHTRAKASLRA